MTRKIGNTVIFESKLPDTCEFCCQSAELRPYGPNNERICFDCAMKDEESARRKFYEFLDCPGEKPQ
jgi:hypothetical protein